MIQKKQMTVEELEKVLGYQVEVVDKQMVDLEDVEPGQWFNFCGTSFIVLEHTNIGTYVLTKYIPCNSIFDSASNNYENSMAAKQVKEFERVFAEKCAECGLNYGEITVPRQMSLLAMDGRRDYGGIGCIAGLMSVRQYQEYVYLLDKHKVNANWFLCTPASTGQNNCTEFVTCVNHKNFIEPASIRSTYGIRPMLMFKRDIVVEVVKKIL